MFSGAGIGLWDGLYGAIICLLVLGPAANAAFTTMFIAVPTGKTLTGWQSLGGSIHLLPLCYFQSVL